MSLYLAKGRHSTGPHVCLAELVDLLMRGRIHYGKFNPEEFRTDFPSCMCPTVASAVHRINDTLCHRDRQRLVLLLPRLVRARSIPGKEDRIAIRLAQWARRRVLRYVDPEIRERCERNIAQLDRLLWEPLEVVHPDLDDRHWQHGMNSAAWAAMSTSPGEAIRCALVALDDADGEDLVMILDELLDAWEKTVVEEGESTWDPDIEYPTDEEIDEVIRAILPHHRES